MIDERGEYCDKGCENLIRHKDRFQYQKLIHSNKLNLNYTMNDSIPLKWRSFDMMNERIFPLQ